MTLHKSTKYLVVQNIMILFLVVLTFLFMAGLSVPLPLPFTWHKWLHLFGVVIFLGNIIVTGYWMFMIEKTGNEEFIKRAIILVNWADVIFTGPGIILAYSNGLLISQVFGGVKATLWMIVGVSLFIFSGLLWAFYLIPQQNKLTLMAEGSGPLGKEFYMRLRHWYVWGAIATIIPLITMILMVVKP